MLLTEFKVKGYKNITETITFAPLGRINVIHGTNNVGKSNLLQAIDLYFRLLEIAAEDSSNEMSASILEQIEYPLKDIFNLINPMPLEFTGTFRFTDEEIKDSTSPLKKEVTIGVQVKRFFSNSVKITVINTANITLADITNLQPFALFKVNRHLLEYDNSSTAKIVPQELRDKLFDAKESYNVSIARSWELFVKIMRQFQDITGEGQFSTSFNRSKNQADLLLDTGNMRIPVDLLGTGVQQIVALLGQLLLTSATFIGIEEPELNLRYTLQKRLLAAFKEIVEDEYGPNQLFLTSHSPAFEAEQTFFAMEIKDNIPTLSQQPKQLAGVYTGYGFRNEETKFTEMHAKRPEPACYVSSEGLVLLPDKVRRGLKVEQGGGISFMTNKDTKHFEIWTLDEIGKFFGGDNGSDS